MTDTIAGLIGRHPTPEGYVPRKSELAQLVDRYGVGNIPLKELHRINCMSADEFVAVMDAAKAENARSVVDQSGAATRRMIDEARARRSRQDAMADEWAASHVR